MLQNDCFAETLMSLKKIALKEYIFSKSISNYFTVAFFCFPKAFTFQDLCKDACGKTNDFVSLLLYKCTRKT